MSRLLERIRDAVAFPDLVPVEEWRAPHGDIGLYQTPRGKFPLNFIGLLLDDDEEYGKLWWCSYDIHLTTAKCELGLFVKICGATRVI